jgi:hypothetical protein
VLAGAMKFSQDSPTSIGNLNVSGNFEFNGGTWYCYDNGSTGLYNELDVTGTVKVDAGSAIVRTETLTGHKANDFHVIVCGTKLDSGNPTNFTLSGITGVSGQCDSPTDFEISF